MKLTRDQYDEPNQRRPMKTNQKFATSLLNRKVRLVWGMSEEDIASARVQFAGKGHYQYAGSQATIRTVVPMPNGLLNLYVEVSDGRLISVNSDSVTLLPEENASVRTI